MNFGVLNLLSYVPELDGSPADVLHGLVEDAGLCEELGYDAFWLTEHHFENFGGLLSAPALIMSAISQRTARMRLGIGVSLLPLHHPLTMAEEWATVDVLSNGRLELGIGMGFSPWEYGNFGVELDGALERLDETLAIMLRAWQGGRFDHHGKSFSWQGLQVLPAPIQRPHPPVWAAAVKTDSSYTWAGSHGCHLMTAPFLADAAKLPDNIRAYWQSLANAGHTTDGKQVLANLQVCVAPTREEAFATASASFARTNAVRREAIMRGTNRDGAVPTASRIAGIDQAAVADLVRAGKMVVGTPTDCAEVLRRLNDELGIDLFLGTFHFGGMVKEKVHQSLRLFMQEVAPRVRGLSPVRVSSAAAPARA